VQGVGYRPFVYNRAVELGLSGTVYNGAGKVFVYAEGDPDALERLGHDLVHAAPPLARPELASCDDVPPEGHAAFRILASDAATEAEIHVPPDLFTCDDCLAELTDSAERRYGYPFINCTQCGPRYTIIEAMPYDRPNTSMAAFPLCDACRAEYESPADRRFHAQPLACPECGPRLEFVRPDVGVASAATDALNGRGLSRDSMGPSRLKPLPQADREKRPLDQAVSAVQAGQILAVKGIGGYHLVCDAANDAAVRRLRERKNRPHKPLAVMFPWRGADGLDAVRAQLAPDATAAAALTDPARPIVLVRKREDFSLSPALAPGLRELGAFLPYSPLHHELLGRLGRPVVATSGNISGEPVITGNAEAQARLSAIADAFLHHDRPIVRPADDPVLRPMAGAARAIRMGRGTAPLERALPGPVARPLLATGGHMKNAIALAWGGRVVVSPHVGDLDSLRSQEVFENNINDIQRLYDVKSEVIACDLHPGYASTRWARASGLPLLRIPHHAAHASALAGEHPGIGPWLVFTWDGVGYGEDGTLWGGEALHGRPGAWRRVGSFRPFRLVGGDRAGREPWRSAAALLWALQDDAPGAGETDFGLAANERALAREAWRRGLNTFETSAVGRLFDAAAALVLGRSAASFEGQGPMELEQAAVAGASAVALPVAQDAAGTWRSDWAPLLPVLSDRAVPTAERAGIFHETMATALLAQARKIREQAPFEAVGLSGGVFQNRLLTERVCELLAAEGIAVRLHEAVPANDGGLCFGQVIEAAARLERSSRDAG
jgi:hydrogenase maturation protein HypF